ncbi:hypothetical protein ACXET9_03275 [Brachybacterium sp. DNPG3]
MVLVLPRPRRRALAGLAFALLATGCAWQPPGGSTVFDVPTFAWEGGVGDSAEVSGTLVIDDEGCTFLDQEMTTGILFPDAIGVALEDGARHVVLESTGEVFATEGGDLSYAGGYGEVPDEWSDTCSATPAEVARVQDSPAGDPLQRT